MTVKWWPGLVQGGQYSRSEEWKEEGWRSVPIWRVSDLPGIFRFKQLHALLHGQTLLQALRRERGDKQREEKSGCRKDFRSGKKNPEQIRHCSEAAASLPGPLFQRFLTPSGGKTLLLWRIYSIWEWTNGEGHYQFSGFINVTKMSTGFSRDASRSWALNRTWKCKRPWKCRAESLEVPAWECAANKARRRECPCNGYASPASILRHPRVCGVRYLPSRHSICIGSQRNAGCCVPFRFRTSLKRTFHHGRALHFLSLVSDDDHPKWSPFFPIRGRERSASAIQITPPLESRTPLHRSVDRELREAETHRHLQNTSIKG